MKNLLKTTAATLAIFLASCAGETPAKHNPSDTTAEKLPNPNPATAADSDTFVVTEGSIRWLGKKNIGGEHTGTIQVAEGFLLVNGSTLSGGRIVIDMNSIRVTDLQDPRERTDLEAHLKDSDFFEVKKFPQGEFLIREVTPSQNEAFNAVA
ncbi:MAG: YceI family protein, partial [Saprospiraceae bacterium]